MLETGTFDDPMLTRTLKTQLAKMSALRGPRLVIAGHSHIHALVGRQPAARRPYAAMVPGYDRIAGLFTDDRDWKYWNKMIKLAAGRPLLLLWGGNEHNTYFLFDTDRPFDFFYADFPISTDREIVPFKLIRAKLQPSIDALRGLLLTLQRRQHTRVIVGGTPPPRLNADVIRSRLRTEPLFLQDLEKLGLAPETAPITPAPVRLKLWTVLQDSYSQITRECGFEYFPVPAALRDSAGYLPDAYCSNDVTHANEDYGKIYLEQFLRHLGMTP